MFYHDPKLQYEVRVEKPDPLYAKMLQQALGGIEGEIRICLQYLFQAWNMPANQSKYREMLLNTGTEEIGHIEMLAVAIAKNLEGAPADMKDEAAEGNPMVAAVLGGMNPRHYLSAGLGAMAVDSSGVPFNGSWVVGSGNLAADMYANLMAESTGRLLVTRLFHMTDDPGMKDMCRFLIARDGMHQNQWLAVIEELGGVEATHPIPASFPLSEQEDGPHIKEKNLGYAYMGTRLDGPPPEGRFTSGPSIDGKGEFTLLERMAPLGEEPKLPPKPPYTFNLPTKEGAMGVMAKAAEKVKDALD